MKKAIDEMRAWLELKKREFFGLPKWRENPDLPFWMKKEIEDIERENAIIDSILAALSGPSEKRRKILAGHLYSWWSTYDFSELHKENYDKIRALILGHAAGEGEKERE